MPEQQAVDMWAIVEVMGHKRYAGHVTDFTLGPVVLLRVDVPETEQPERRTWQGVTPGRTTAAYSKLIGPGSIYQITPCTEDVARRAAVVIEASNDPIPVVLPPERQIAAPSDPAGDATDEIEFDVGEEDDEDELEEEFKSLAGDRSNS